MMFDDEEWLRDNGLWDIADPTELYDKIVERRERGDDGIPAPISKLHGLFTLPLRAVSILGAYSGTGKSTFACQWALSAAASGAVASMALACAVASMAAAAASTGDRGTTGSGGGDSTGDRGTNGGDSKVGLDMLCCLYKQSDLNYIYNYIFNSIM